ncbi:MAG: choice-of-anchor D domain-containing protein [Parcubacteria group bacterium]|nr:choice-of-anchor D domain-containing protein [Parcubacteria group bacterium]
MRPSIFLFCIMLLYATTWSSYSMPDTIDFGEVQKGRTLGKTIAIDNESDDTLYVSIRSLNPILFFTPQKNLVHIPGRETKNITIFFRPISIGYHSNFFIVTINGSLVSDSIALIGIGIDRLSPLIPITPSSLNFGKIIRNQKKELAIKVSNNKKTPVTIYSISTTNDTDFIIADSSMPVVIPPDSVRVFMVTFWPKKVKEYNEQTIVLMKEDGVRRIVMHGKGIAQQDTGEIKIFFLIPATYILYQNYPNPFNARTTISFYLPMASTITLKIYTATGSEIAILFNNEQKTHGMHKVVFDTAHLSSGIYFYRLQTASYSMVGKMVLLK